MAVRAEKERSIARPDVCIIGGGPAAISTALGLRGSGLSVLMVVGGGFAESAEDQALNQGVVVRPGSHEPLEENRRRVWGGASTVWGGRCVPLDKIDFEERDWIPFSGWPIASRDVERYFSEAAEICEICNSEFDEVEEQRGIEGVVNSERLLDFSRIERWSPPTDFGVRYRKVLEESGNIEILFNAHVLRLVSEGPQITHVEAVAGGAAFSIEAKVFVLATGGIENARIMLNSKSQSWPNGIGNENDLVGRYYMCHPHGKIFDVRLDRYNQYYGYRKDRSGVYIRRRWWITPFAQRKYRICNSIFFLDRARSIADSGQTNPLFSLLFIVKRIVSIARIRGWKQKFLELKRSKSYLLTHLIAVLANIGYVVPQATKIVFSRIGSERRLPSVLPPAKPGIWGLYFQAEQAPNRDSRVTLSDTVRDRYGMPVAAVDLRFSHIDKLTAVNAHRIFVSEFNKLGIGSIEWKESEVESWFSSIETQFNSAAHHIGTTRMAATDRDGVVDSNCLVFGTNNLYIAGSSTFPTGGHANPTFTIVALSLRLAGHLTSL